MNVHTNADIDVNTNLDPDLDWGEGSHQASFSISVHAYEELA